MKIAYFTTNRTTIPPEKNIIAASAYLTGLLVDRMVDKGHDVTLYAPKGSKTKARLIDLNLPPSRLDFALMSEGWVENMSLGMKQVYLAELYRNASEYDIIHLQTEPVYLGMPFAKMTSVPTVVTNHNVFLKQEKELLTYYKDIPIVSISEYQKSLIPGLRYVGTIYDGIAVDTFPFYKQEETKDYLYFLARLVTNKGVAEAIKVAQMTNHNLQISGIGTDAFVAEVITPNLSDKISYMGPVDRTSQAWFDHLGQAKVTLSPIQWEEPFGLVMAESMACGTPVIAFARGSVPEIVRDGVTGFIVNPSDDDIRGDFLVKKTGLRGFCEAVERIYSMSNDSYQQMRKNCREHAINNFSLDRMVDGYEELYKNLVEKKTGE